jgi:hypothetical protein
MMMLGNSTEALQVFEATFPNYADETILSEDLPDSERYYFPTYTDLLRTTGQKEKADRFAKKLCEYAQTVKDDPYASNHSRNDLILDCYYLSNRETAFIELLDSLYFKENDRMDWYGNMKSGWYYRFETNQKYQELFNRIEAEVHRHRAEVIEYLKEEGDWDPAWDKELGLD